MRNTGYRILAQGQQVSNDTWATGLNNNDCIIGIPGAGKTRGYVLPNILQCNESMIITDTKGALRQQVGGVLEKRGYRVLELNLADCWASTVGYNPLNFIRFDPERDCSHEQDILTVAASIVPLDTATEPFWDYSARMLLETFIAYILDCQPEEEHTLSSAVVLLSEMGSGATGKLLDEYAAIAPASFAAMRWKLYKALALADRTVACIQGFLAEKLSSMMFDSIADLFTRQNQIDFAALGRERTALFLTISDTDRSLDRLAALFYAQAIQTLCSEADQNQDHRLSIPVRLYLDDFAANVTIPDFDKIISIIRSREISVSIVLQSISQLEALYGPARAQTILNCCDHMLYLGGQDVETARYISAKANKPVSTVLNMPLDSSWLFTRGREPQQVRKYDLTKHPSYRELPEGQRFQTIEISNEDYDNLPF